MKCLPAINCVQKAHFMAGEGEGQIALPHAVPDLVRNHAPLSDLSSCQPNRSEGTFTRFPPVNVLEKPHKG